MGGGVASILNLKEDTPIEKPGKNKEGRGV